MEEFPAPQATLGTPKVSNFSKYSKITEKWVSDQGKLKDSKWPFRFLN
jgi:hypothetical protein